MSPSDWLSPSVTSRETENSVISWMKRQRWQFFGEVHYPDYQGEYKFPLNIRISYKEMSSNTCFIFIAIIFMTFHILHGSQQLHVHIVNHVNDLGHTHRKGITGPHRPGSFCLSFHTMQIPVSFLTYQVLGINLAWQPLKWVSVNMFPAIWRIWDGIYESLGIKKRQWAWEAQ